MKVLIDIVHPADVLFFLHPIRRLLNCGHTVQIAARRKDVTEALLHAFDLTYTSISSAGESLPGLAMEMLRRDMALWGLIRRQRPDVMCGFGGVAISHIGRLAGIPAVSFYDTDRAPLQNGLSLPFITHLYVPQAYDGPEAKGRTTRFPGIKELSYFHPENFSADRELALAGGLSPETRNYFIRLVSWRANHDVGRGGWDAATLESAVTWLSSRGRVHISSESPLPEHLRGHEYTGRPEQLHHLLAHCDLYLGESATMAAEAVLLGIPAIYAAADRRGYTDELAREGLLTVLTGVTGAALITAIERSNGENREVSAGRLQRWLEDKPNLAGFVVSAIERHAGKHE